MGLRTRMQILTDDARGDSDHVLSAHKSVTRRAMSAADWALIGKEGCSRQRCFDGLPLHQDFSDELERIIIK